jgi:hypothetical protein
VAVLVLPAALLVGLRVQAGLDLRYRDVHFHIWIVSGIAACAAVVALVAAAAAARSRHHSAVWLAVGCLTVGFLMLAHGILTPGVHHRAVNTWVGRLPFVAIPAFALCLLLASRPRNARTSRLVAAHPVALLVVVAAALAAFVVAVHLDPGLWWGRTEFPHEELIRSVVLFGTAPLLLVVTWQHWLNFRLGGDPVQLALVFAAAMCFAAMASMRYGVLWQLSWWNYHVFLFLGFVGAVAAIAVRGVRARQVEQVFAVAFETNAMVHLVEGYPEALQALVRAVELKDAYTAGHSERTAAIAVQLGVRMGVAADTLRAVARGGYLHDVGKLLVPDAILNKPAALDATEWAIVQTHPRAGYELVLPAVELHECLGAVLHHHERWDGAGYPTGVAGADIPLIARIVAVADVWDALTSDRAYRPGLEPDEALGHIVAGRGAHFDPRVVDAFVGLATDWGYLPAYGGDAEQAWHAGQTCHEVGTTCRA